MERTVEETGSSPSGDHQRGEAGEILTQQVPRAYTETRKKEQKIARGEERRKDTSRVYRKKKKKRAKIPVVLRACLSEPASSGAGLGRFLLVLVSLQKARSRAG
jgi:hypothetical protein